MEQRIDIDELAKQISQNLRNVPIFEEKDLDSCIEKADLLTHNMKLIIYFISKWNIIMLFSIF